MGLFDGDCAWYCDECHTYLNNQPGFTTSMGTWICTECGATTDVSEQNIIPESGSNGYVFETEYEDGTIEKIRYTKTREIHDFDGPNGKISIWHKR